MAMDYFVGWTMADKLKYLRALQEQALTGQVTSHSLGGGVATTFDNKVPAELRIQRIMESIVADPEFDSTDPVQAACLRNQRPGRTIPIHY